MITQNNSLKIKSNINRQLIFFLFLSTLLLILWSFIIPIFEGPDENLHWQYANHLKYSKSLPVYKNGFGEANSPPLYYLLISPLALNTELPEIYKNKNGYGPIVSKDGIIHPRGIKVFKNTNEDFKKYWPIRFARFITVIFSSITIFFCYLLGKESTGKHLSGILTASLIAFLPQFSFRCSHISNDALLTTFCAIFMYLCIIIYKYGFSWKKIILLSLTFAGAFLTKITALILPIPLFFLLYKNSKWKIFLTRISVFTLISFIIISPWIFRNIVLYGDPFALEAMKTAVPSLLKIKSLFSPYFITIFPTLLIKSFIGAFGWMTIFLTNWLYLFYYLIGLISLSGLLYGVITNKTDKILLTAFSLFPILSLIIVIRINLMFNQPQGRYLFASLPAISLLLCLGFQLLPLNSEKIIKLLITILFLLNIFILMTIVYPSYWPA